MVFDENYRLSRTDQAIQGVERCEAELCWTQVRGGWAVFMYVALVLEDRGIFVAWPNRLYGIVKVSPTLPRKTKAAVDEVASHIDEQDLVVLWRRMALRHRFLRESGYRFSGSMYIPPSSCESCARLDHLALVEARVCRAVGGGNDA